MAMVMVTVMDMGNGESTSQHKSNNKEAKKIVATTTN